jgi:hypothetical protein
VLDVAAVRTLEHVEASRLRPPPYEQERREESVLSDESKTIQAATGSRVSSAPQPRFSGRDGLEWEVRMPKNRLYKGQGSTPEAALCDLRDSFALGLKDAQEAAEREQKRLTRMSDLVAVANEVGCVAQEPLGSDTHGAVPEAAPLPALPQATSSPPASVASDRVPMTESAET